MSSKIINLRLELHLLGAIELTHPPPPPSCRIYASVNWVSIGSDNSFSPVRRQAITWTNADLMQLDR